ncbi:MAG: pseudouridine synthase [Candidatus Parcubacteria bacterium]|nr:pseudouridine synthase [Candidatus Parcubacteria bacterium]
MRINKYLADQKISTRRGADELIKNKKVFINGKLAVLGSQVNETDKVEVRGAPKKDYVYFAYNKPIGIETNSPREDLFPLGRLDKNSHGLLILTNDGRITDQLLNPKYVHEKEYVVRTSNKLRSSFKNKMEAGVNIDPVRSRSPRGDRSTPVFGRAASNGVEGYITKPCKVKILSDFTFKIILTEGKKHQIRRMCSALFQEIADLKRERIMNIKLGSLKSGGLREIKGEELETFLHFLK